MKWTKQELDWIEHLKEPKNAQPVFVLRTEKPAAYKVLTKVGIGNCLVLFNEEWHEPMWLNFWDSDMTYIIAPEFKPKDLCGN